ncbi:MAG: cell division protein FtsA [Acidobacteria bacterium]|uniref:Cell division protein FtsA n=1 Tax=Candidatus Polarisedimenticola svalbardensis TaxID=2886004 RepID=A0A8J6XYW2_9BACT|nr:cell division protein FtsA [Candidatus Polarisedimenticola svalbardensis]
MKAKNGTHVVGLDIGTTKISCVVADVMEDGRIHIIGLGETPSRGLRKGVVVNLNATVEAVKNCLQQAELMAGIDIETAVVGIAGGHIRSFNSRGVVAVSGRDRTVTQEDIDRVMEAARAVNIPNDREILHVLPQEYVLDDQGSISSPMGMTGSRLEANVHIITAASTSVQNLVTCVNRAGVEVQDTVLEQLASSESVLTDDERELGVALIDIGGGTTDLAIFERGSKWHTSVLPVGGDHFSNDLAVGLRTPVPEAEKLKIRYGCALSSQVREDETIEVPTVGGRKPRLLSRQVMAEILQPRAEEIFNLILKEVTTAGFERVLNAGIVLTGGGSLLPGMVEVAEQVFDLPVRHGLPTGADGLVEPASGPEFATVIGLALYGAHHASSTTGARLRLRPGIVGAFNDRLRSWFSEVF